MSSIDSYTVKSSDTIKVAIKKMDKGGIGFICTTDLNNAVTAVVSDGDFRRAILKGVNLESEISEISNKKFKHLNKGFKRGDAEIIFRNTVAKRIPVLDQNKQLVEIIKEEEFWDTARAEKYEKLNSHVVIMAGGKGTRLDPFTKILPKPLIPIGDKTILEIIIQKFLPYQVDHFYISVNHKANIIKSYFEDIARIYEITYLYEEKPLGTIGALKQLQGLLNSDVIITNCDVIIDADYADLLKFHQAQGNDITIVASLKHYNIPYGICEIENGGQLKAIKEKPEWDFLVNTGMYVIKPKVIEMIPENEFYHITYLVSKLKNAGGKVGVYPISENAWVDTGEWVEYKKAVEKLRV